MSKTLVPARQLAAKAKTPFPGASAAYDAAREALLAEEIELRRHATRLVDQRRSLPPGPVIGKDYRFKDEQGFDVGLLELFGDKDALVTYFWMYGPQRERPCPMCTNLLGAIEGNGADIQQRIQTTEAERARIYEEQERIRANLEAVPEGSDMQRRYLASLATQEDRLTAIETELQALQSQLAAAEAALRDYVMSLNL